MPVKSRQPLPEIGRCVWRELIGNRPRRAQHEECKHRNTETNCGQITFHSLLLPFVAAITKQIASHFD